jgi:hypothetical protein
MTARHQARAAIAEIDLHLARMPSGPGHGLAWYARKEALLDVRRALRSGLPSQLAS